MLLATLPHGSPPRSLHMYSPTLNSISVNTRLAPALAPLDSPDFAADSLSCFCEEISIADLQIGLSRSLQSKMPRLAKLNFSEPNSFEPVALEPVALEPVVLESVALLPVAVPAVSRTLAGNDVGEDSDVASRLASSQGAAINEVAASEAAVSEVTTSEASGLSTAESNFYSALNQAIDQALSSLDDVIPLSAIPDDIEAEDILVPSNDVPGETILDELGTDIDCSIDIDVNIDQADVVQAQNRDGAGGTDGASSSDAIDERALLDLLSFPEDAPGSGPEAPSLQGSVTLEITCSGSTGNTVSGIEQRFFTDSLDYAPLMPGSELPAGTIINFDEINAVPLPAGTVVAEQFNGITISTPDHQFGAMLFDSEKPTGGDWDLRTRDQGNVLIISEDGDSTDPDDNAAGGTLRFDFDTPTDLESIGLLDIDAPGSRIALFSGDGSLIRSVDVVAAGDNRQQSVDLNAEDVSRLEVFFPSSGAVTGLEVAQASDDGSGEEDLLIGLYDASTNQLVTGLEDGDSLAAADFDLNDVNVAAVIPNDSSFFEQVGSMQILLNGTAPTDFFENVEPYALFGDTRGDFFQGALSTGSNSIAFELYSEKNGQGQLLATIERSFTIS